jgi:Terminase small subunit
MASQDLTLKQRKWLNAYLKTGNATQAAKDAGYDCVDDNGFAQIGWENLRKLDYTEFLEAAGITDNLLQQKIMEGLKANKQIGAQILIDADGNVVSKENEGMIEVPDNGVRHKYLETALRLKQRLLTRFDVTSSGEPIAILGGITKTDALSTNNSNTEVAPTDKKD